MRKVGLFLALAVGFAAYAGANIKWDHTRHDFGAFDESLGAVTARFVLYNTGDEPLVITGARANCGCTTPTYTADIVQPGDSAVLSVAYDPGGRPGRFEKKVYVDTNTEPKRSTLTITGVSVGSSASVEARYPVAVGPLRMAHSAALLGSMNRGHVKSVFESGYNASTDTLRPSVENVPKWLDVKVIPPVVPPGEQVSFNIFVHSDRVPVWDLASDTLTVRPFPGSPDRFDMPVVVTVTEDFSGLSDRQLAQAPAVRLDRTRLDPVTLAPGDNKVSFTVLNEGRSPLKIRRVYTRTPGVTFDVKRDEAVKPGKSRTVAGNIPASCLNGAKTSVITVYIITNDPLNPKATLTIPVTTD